MRCTISVMATESFIQSLHLTVTSLFWSPPLSPSHLLSTPISEPNPVPVVSFPVSFSPSPFPLIFTPTSFISWTHRQLLQAPTACRIYRGRERAVCEGARQQQLSDANVHTDTCGACNTQEHGHQCCVQRVRDVDVDVKRSLLLSSGDKLACLWWLFFATHSFGNCTYGVFLGWGSLCLSGAMSAGSDEKVKWKTKESSGISMK